ncbi:MAG TPA: CCA tRNA nucleotidyltransferase [Candidatus Sulfotelmatobacter sp.]|jgi:poly(A) polymerase|nr:CCA tRNA nucleotidyltransferase [Candidatus Sulfotelmatobacter sp.]
MDVPEGLKLPKDEPVGQLPPQAWMRAEETRAVIAALTADGAEVRFAGGCVRDSVLGRPIRDIDIATHDPPDAVLSLLERAGIRAIPTGIAHGTVTAVVNHEHFEITTLRCDVETFGRHAKVAFTDDWTLDAARRDLTINAMFATPDGLIYDPYEGLLDLGAGRVRFVGNARQRIEEDVLRLLRFFRFQAYYGRPPADLDALLACRALAHRLPELSGERVSGEVFKLLLSPDPSATLLLMRGERVLEYLLPEAGTFGRLRILTFLETRAMARPNVAPDPLRRLAALMPVDRRTALAVAGRLRLSNAETVRLGILCAPDVWPSAGMDDRAARRMLHRLGADIFRDLTLIAWAGRKDVEARTPSGENDLWQHLLDLADEWRPVSLPVKGQDVIDRGIPRGPGIGRILGRLEEWWEAGDYRAGRGEALALLEKLCLEEREKA